LISVSLKLESGTEFFAAETGRCEQTEKNATNKVEKSNYLNVLAKQWW